LSLHADPYRANFGIRPFPAALPLAAPPSKEVVAEVLADKRQGLTLGHF
jgi:hypothetical protein